MHWAPKALPIFCVFAKGGLAPTAQILKFSRRCVPTRYTVNARSPAWKTGARHVSTMSPGQHCVSGATWTNGPPGPTHWETTSMQVALAVGAVTIQACCTSSDQRHEQAPLQTQDATSASVWNLGPTPTLRFWHRLADRAPGPNTKEGSRLRIKVSAVFAQVLGRRLGRTTE